MTIITFVSTACKSILGRHKNIPERGNPLNPKGDKMMTVKRTVVTGDGQMTLNPRDVHMRIGGIFGGYRFDERELRGFRDSDALREYIESHCTAENLMSEFAERHGMGKETAEYVACEYQQMLYHWMDVRSLFSV